MNLSDHAPQLLDLARAETGGREWMLPEGVPLICLSWENRNKGDASIKQAAMRLPVTVYTDNGYGARETVHVPFGVGPEGLHQPHAISATIRMRLSGIIARHEKLGHEPARYDEFDPDLSHLCIDPIFGRHLNERHGDDAPRIARRLVGRVLRRERRTLDKRLPKGSEAIVETATVASRIISGNVPLGDGIVWKSQTIVIPDVILSETIVSAMRGQPVSRVVRHDMLGDAAITQMTSVERTSGEGGGTTTIRVDIPVVPVREFWPSDDSC